MARNMQLSVHSVLAELGEQAELIDTQVQVGMTHDEVRDACFVSIKSKIGALGTTTSKDKNELTKAINNGPWTPDEKKELARVLLSGGGGEKGAQRQRRENQKCKNIENMLSQDVFVKLRDMRASQIMRASWLAQAATTVGIILPDQPTLFRMVAILAYCENNYDMTQSTVHMLMDKLQSFIKASKPPTGTPFIVNYPPSAEGLPEVIKQAAFNGDVPPVVDIPELNVILGGNRMRGRDKTTGPSWLQHVPVEFRQLVLSALQHGSASSSSAKPSAGAAVAHDFLGNTRLRLRGKTSPKKVDIAPDALADGEPMGDLCDGELKLEDDDQPKVKKQAKNEYKSESEGEGDDMGVCGVTSVTENTGRSNHAAIKRESIKHEQDKAKGSIDEMEAALLGGGGRAQGRGGGVAKRPAAAHGGRGVKKTVLKRPAASIPKADSVNMYDAFKKLKADRGSGVSRNTYVCRAYNQGQRAMLACGAADDEAKEFGRCMMGLAGELFDGDDALVESVLSRVRNKDY